MMLCWMCNSYKARSIHTLDPEVTSIVGLDGCEWVKTQVWNSLESHGGWSGCIWLPEKVSLSHLSLGFLICSFLVPLWC